MCSEAEYFAMRIVDFWSWDKFSEPNIFGVVFPFVMGFVLDIKNRKARNVNYVKYNGAASASWMSRNMALSGGVILAFLSGRFWRY